MRLETAPTGPGGNIELPNYFFQLHTDCGTKDHLYEKAKLGFTLPVYKQVLLNDRASIVFDRGLLLTVQPNLRNY